ncbi:MAG: F0F1 ATP synthase subunit C [Alphaproteobacteria bacterium]|nr:F0F1 ATP synthase subunit C [Alphaproteobacteria bacterium]
MEHEVVQQVQNNSEALRYIGLGLTMLGGGIGAGYGISAVFSNWLNAIARNPSSADKLSMVGFIGFAATELVLLMTFVIAILLIFAV